MKRILLSFCILLCSLNIWAQTLTISDSAKISLITCSPGPEIYAKFGHTAIRVQDDANNVDVVFNYGIFSFNTSNFYYKFVKGETDYQLGIYETSFFLPEYKERNSSVWEQQLNLTASEKRKLFGMLMENYLPQNRIYRYNFIFDNCATRPRDKILSSLNSYVKFEAVSDQKTFRQWVGTYVGNDSWIKFGIDLLFGLDADRTTSLSESLFLPEILMTEFQSATIEGKNEPARKLVKEKTLLVSKNIDETEPASRWIFKPLGAAILLLIVGIIITAWDANRHRHLKIFDSLLLITTGLTGLIVCFMMLFSTHPLVKNNLNILWLNPLNIILGILIWIKNVDLRRMIFFYQIFNITLLIVSLFCFALSIQSFNIATFPLIVLLLIRSTRWFAYTKHKLYKRREMR